MLMSRFIHAEQIGGGDTRLRVFLRKDDPEPVRVLLNQEFL